MEFSRTRSLEFARDILEANRDLKHAEIVEEVRRLVDRHTGLSNEVLAAVALDAYIDACDAWEVPAYSTHFAEAFPTFAEFV